ncbi:MAG: rhomboid family intramembrane serine protease [Acidimicrobiales bacterium]
MTIPQLSCYRHADRGAGVSCQRCDRPICPDCMISASVGFHCPNCARSNAQRVVKPSARWSNNQTMVRPVATLVIIAINVAVFMFDYTQRNSVLFERFALIGYGNYRDIGEIGVAQGEWWRLVTGGFLHGGAMHLAFNMFALWSLGQIMEQVLGSVRFAAAYMASLLAGSFGVMVLSPNDITVGASGAVFGLFGLLLMLQLSRSIPLRQTGLGLTLALNLGITFVIPNISIGGHLGGLAGGAVIGLSLFGLPRSARQPNAAVGWAVIAAVAVVATIGAVALASRPPIFGGG